VQNPSYDEIFQRNIGVFTPEEQEKIKSLKIAVIGVGGLGGPVTENLARLGVGELRLVEPDTFESSNINRQTGAYVDTLGRNKADVLAEIARRVNPEIKVTVKTGKLFGNDLKRLIEGCDVVVDGIDYFNIDEEIELHELAKNLNIPIITSEACFSILSFSLFDPEKSMLSDFITGDDYVEKIMQATNLFFPVYPEELTEKVIAEMVGSYLAGQGIIDVPSVSINAPIGGAIVTKFIIDLLIKEDKKKFLPVMPDLLYVNTNDLEIKRVVK